MTRFYEIHKGDILWCDFGKGAASEQWGVRPAVVVSVDAINATSPCVTVCPMTSRPKRLDLPEHVSLKWRSVKGDEKESVVLCEQVRTISKQRILSLGGFVKSSDIPRIENGVKKLFGF